MKCSNSKSEEQLAGSGIPLVPAQALTDQMAVVGGTTWMFCRDELSEQFDLLVIDEAGQMSLANLLVMARCAKTILLVGDQQRVAVMRRLQHPLGRQDAGPAGFVFHDDGNPQAGLGLLAENPGHGVGKGSRHRRHHQGDRPVGKGDEVL